MRYRGIAVALGALGALDGCKSDTGVYEQTNVDTWFQAPTNEVDILFVVDDSHSMKEEQAAVAAGFDSFIGQLETTGTDFHLGVITTSFDYDDPDRGKLVGSPTVLTRDTPGYSDLFKARVQVGVDGADKEKAFEATDYALSAAMQMGANIGFLRSEAYLEIVFVSDENDCSDEGALEGQSADACYTDSQLLVPVDDYVYRYRQLKDDPSYVQIGAIVGPKSSGSNCPDATPGLRYFDLAGQMGGALGDICDTDYSPILGQLGTIASGILTSFQLTEPAQVDTLEVHVANPDGSNDQIIPQDPTNGWTYDETTHYVTFNGTSVPARGAEITAKYTIQAGG